MTEPDRCSRCRRAAVAHQPYSGRALCAEHLVRDVESRAKRTLRQQAGLRHGDRVGVLAPCGPYGEALLAFVARQFAARRDLSLVALVPGGAQPPALPEGLEAAAIGDEDPHAAAGRLGCTMLALPVTLEERAADVLGAVLAGRSAGLAGPGVRGGLRLVRPFEHVPGLELRLYLAALTGSPPLPEPPSSAGPFEAFVADELARHTARHPSAPFALVRLADTLATLVAGERDAERVPSTAPVDRRAARGRTDQDLPARLRWRSWPCTRSSFTRSYPVLEGRPISWTESLLFVMETLTTVGYGELLPFESEWMSFLSILMMTTGIVMFFMAVPLLLTPLLSRMLHSTPPRRTSRALEDHVVIFGYDDTVRSILESLRIGDVPVVVVEKDEETAMHAYTRYRGTAHVVWGDPGLASTRAAVSLGAARYVVVVGSEQRAANTLLAIRGRTPAALIAVVDDPAFDRYLRYAGAEYVLSPKHMVGRMLARHGYVAADVESVADATPPDSVLSRPPLNGQDLVLVKAPVLRGSPAIDRTLAEIGFYPKYGVEPLIFWRGGQFTLLPGGDAEVDASAMLFLLGRGEDIADAIEHELWIPDQADRHAVIAGFGDVGSAAYHELVARKIDCTVIDPQPHEVPTVIGRAEDEAVLMRSGIEAARTPGGRGQRRCGQHLHDPDRQEPEPRPEDRGAREPRRRGGPALPGRRRLRRAPADHRGPGGRRDRPRGPRPDPARPAERAARGAAPVDARVSAHGGMARAAHGRCRGGGRGGGGHCGPARAGAPLPGGRPGDADRRR